jgi:hypothetical protein
MRLNELQTKREVRSQQAEEPVRVRGIGGKISVKNLEQRRNIKFSVKIGKGDTETLALVYDTV